MAEQPVMDAAEIERQLHVVTEHARLAHQAALTGRVRHITGQEDLETRFAWLQQDVGEQNARLGRLQEDVGALAAVVRSILPKP